MPRKSRDQSETGIYHVMFRGINKQEIFMEDRDNRRFMEAVERAKRTGKFKLIAYCLMKNHVHLVIKEEEESIGKSMQRIGISYATWHNNKYGRVGYLFQNRFMSEPVNTDSYLLTVTRYIHQNPFKANMVKEISAYPWSSYPAYLEHYKGNIDLVDTKLITGYFNSRTAFEDYMNEANNDKCLELIEINKYTDDELRYKLKNHYGINSKSDIKNRDELNRIINIIYEENNTSIRQLSRVLEIGKGVVERALNKALDTSPCLLRR